MSFDVYVNRILKHEGGHIDHPSDPGGATNLGITVPILSRGIREGIIGPTGIKQLTKAQAILLYKKYFWEEPQYDKLPSALGFQVFDAGVNHGTARATMWLQDVLGVAADGKIGPITIAKAHNKNSSSDTERDWNNIAGFWEVRVAFYTKLSTFATFGKGWMNRMVGNFGYAQEDL